MNSLAITPPDILDFGLQAASRGEDIALVTLVGLDLSSPRALGAQMVVTRDGNYRGSFTAGCVEAAIVAEAQATLYEGKSRLVRFGVGSPYIDIRLPCGGGIDLLFTPRPDPSALAGILAALERRDQATMCIRRDGISLTDPAAATLSRREDAFYVSYVPRLRILALGQGDTLVAMARLAHFFGTITTALSPSREDVETLLADGIDATLLTSPSSMSQLAGDPWTAITFVFHDHDWEDALLLEALRQPHLFVGAIGGEQSRKNRTKLLNASGIQKTHLKNFASPVGLIPAARDPATLALSIVAQIVGAYQSAQSRALQVKRDGQLADAFH